MMKSGVKKIAKENVISSSRKLFFRGCHVASSAIKTENFLTL